MLSINSPDGFKYSTDTHASREICKIELKTSLQNASLIRPSK